MSAPLAGYVHPMIEWNGLTATDLFCGAGGSSSGLVAAGYKVVIAANHWQMAIDSHQLNHPDTDHTNADISQVEPSWFPTTDVLWASPECTNHSVAKGVKRQRALNEALFDLNGTRPLPDEAANRSRATMWDVPRFAEYHHYKAIIIENVVDAYRWIPFPAWLQSMELLGYEHEIVWLNSMHAQAFGMPAPQSRDRMYIVFWLKGRKVKGGMLKPQIQKWTRPDAFCPTDGLVSAVQVMKKKEQVLARKPAKGGAVWREWEIEMWRKTVLRAAAKSARLVDESLALAIEADQAIISGDLDSRTIKHVEAETAARTKSLAELEAAPLDDVSPDYVAEGEQ